MHKPKRPQTEKTMTTQTEVLPAAQANHHALPATTTATPGAVLMYAMEKGANLEQIEKLLDLQMKWEASEARKAFVADMAEFKKNPPTIFKDKHVAFKTNSGMTEYDHATIGNVTGKIITALASYGFSHSWKTEQRDGRVIVTCVITHRQGHSESFTLESAPDQSGGKNSIQAIVSAQTYLQRHTLLAATGLATHDQEDNDGAFVGIDTALADKWIASAGEAQDITALEAVWNNAIKEIRAADDTFAYDEVKKAVNARKAELNGGKK
jgi:hypothetical protein